MSFRDCIDRYADFDFPGFFARVSDADVERALAAEKPGVTDFLTLLAPAAANSIEAMAQRASQLTVQHFGRTIQMFIPLYLSNHCTNRCAYCGFNVGNDMPRRVLDLDAIEAEAEAIARTGMQHVLILTGEDRRITPPDYIAAAARCLKRHFASISIEVYPLHEAEYRDLRAAGVNGMTVFQETYDPVTYRRVHLGGKKRDYGWRLDAPNARRAPGCASSTSVRCLVWPNRAAKSSSPACMHAISKIISCRPKSPFRCRASTRPRALSTPTTASETSSSSSS